MGRGLRLDIPNDDTLVILVEKFCWNFPAGDFAKDGIGHFALTSAQLFVGGQDPSLALEHDGNVITDGVGKTTRTTNQLLLFLIVLKGCLRHRTNQDFKELGVEHRVSPV